MTRLVIRGGQLIITCMSSQRVFLPNEDVDHHEVSVVSFAEPSKKTLSQVSLLSYFTHPADRLTIETFELILHCKDATEVPL